MWNRRVWVFAGLLAACAAWSVSCSRVAENDPARSPVLAQAPMPAVLAPMAADGGAATPPGHLAHGSANRSSRARGNDAVDRIDLTQPGAVHTGVSPATVVDTRAFAQPLNIEQPFVGRVRRVREVLPAHGSPRPLHTGGARGLPVGGVLDHVRTAHESLFPGIGQTGWVPPDPTLAVGPQHIVTTVNMAIAFYTKAGNLQFSADLSNAGNPGFFEDVGAGGFTFDPKCFYDHLAQRFVVVAPEVYGSTEAWICIAVSDDSDPNGVWYKYRTDAVITVGTQTFWWDYPGFGYDNDGYYVTSNLFGLNQGGWGGVGFRVFHKLPMLTGQPVVFSTLRDGGSASAQVAQHFGPPAQAANNQAPFFVSLGNGVRVHAITNPLTNPQLTAVDVPVPAFQGPGGAPANGGNTVSLVDVRLFNAQWRDGHLYTAHNIFNGIKNVARWYHLRTNSWPASGSPTLVESGEIDPGGDLHSFFPAIYANKYQEVGMVIGTSGPTNRITVSTVGRDPADPPGTMGTPTTAKLASVDSGGRWGDYYDIAIDPNDDRKFWIIGEYPSPSGWATWISSFWVNTGSNPVAVPDDAGVMFSGDQAVIDVLDNDYSLADRPLTILSFDAVSTGGGSVTRSVGTGEGGRDELIYTAPFGTLGTDTFSYTVQDSQGLTSNASVSAQVFDPALFKEPDVASNPLPGVAVDYYALDGSPSVLPDFGALTPYSTTSLADINVASTGGTFANSGRSDLVGAVFTGFVNVPEDAIYTLSLTSDDGSALYIANQRIIENDGLHGMIERSGSIGLKAGTHKLRIEFFENGGGAGLVASIEGGGLAKQTIPASMWTRELANPEDYRDPDNPPFTLPGVDALYYEVGALTQLPDFSTLSAYATGVSGNVQFPSSNGDFADSGRSDNVAAQFFGYVDAPETNEYTFYTVSDEGSRLYIGDTLVVDNDGIHTLRTRSGNIKLKAGRHLVRVDFFERSGVQGLITQWSSSTISKVTIPAEYWFRDNPCPADYNNDGSLDAFDYDDFVSAYFDYTTNGVGFPDFNNDGAVDAFDYDDFVSAYFTGC